MMWKDKYRDAHKLHQAKATPNAVKSFGYVNTIFPKVQTSNGLTTAILSFLNWSGHRATRINVAGRLIEKAERQESGTVLTTRKYLPSTTRRGTADISSTIRGKSVMFEIKIGYDAPSEHQLREQKREEDAGGKYYFIHSIDEFFEVYDNM